MDDFGIIITAYKQLSETRNNIELIRNQFKNLNNARIVIVSTSQEEIGFESLCNDYDNVDFVHFSNAPGNANCTWFQAPEHQYRNWRHKYLPARILLSIQKGCVYAYDIGIRKILHLHSDTYWKPAAESILEEQIRHIDNCMAIADISSEDEGAAKDARCLPPMMHWLPEAMMLNLDKCKSCGFVFNFWKIYQLEHGFKSHNYGSIESLIGNHCVWSLTGKCITKFEDKIPDEYFQNVYFRMDRTYHGNFQHIDNLRGMQPDAG